MSKRDRFSDEDREYIEECVKRNVGSAFFYSISQRVADVVSNEAQHLKRIKELEEELGDVNDKVEQLLHDDIIDECDACGYYESVDLSTICDVCNEGVFCNTCANQPHAVFKCDDCDWAACRRCLFTPEYYDDICSHVQILCHNCTNFITKDVDSYECKLHEDCPFLVCSDCKDKE